MKNNSVQGQEGSAVSGEVPVHGGYEGKGPYMEILSPDMADNREGDNEGAIRPFTDK